jgi:hypothetical protein
VTDQPPLRYDGSAFLYEHHEFSPWDQVCVWCGIPRVDNLLRPVRCLLLLSPDTPDRIAEAVPGDVVCDFVRTQNEG